MVCFQGGDAVSVMDVSGISAMQRSGDCSQVLQQAVVYAKLSPSLESLDMASADEDSAKQPVRRRPHKRAASQELTTSTSGDGKRRAASKGSPAAAGSAEAPPNNIDKGMDVEKAAGAAVQDTSERTSMMTAPATEPSATSADKPNGIKAEPESAAPTIAAVSSIPATQNGPDSEATASPPKSDPLMQPTAHSHGNHQHAAAEPHQAPSPPTCAQEAALSAAQAAAGALSMSGVAVAVQRELARAAQQGLQPRLEDIMNALRTSSAATNFPGAPLPTAAITPPPPIAVPLPPSLPPPAPALVPVPATSPTAAVAAAAYSDGLRAVGAVSPAPAAPTPVVQQQPAAVAAAGTPEGKPRATHHTDDDPLMLDAAEVLMSLVKQPGPEATDQSCTADTATDPTAALGGGRSPSGSPHAVASDGTAGGGGAMGTETDGSGRRSSRRRRLPNPRIVDELEPSEREKAWGRGRGRRKLASDKPVPERHARVPGGRSRQPGTPADGEPEAAAAAADRVGSEGILTLEALRQMRERSMPIVGLELLVSSDGKWLPAKVHKVDHDFKKVVIKYTQSGQVATLNWHKGDTKSRVALSRSAVDAIKDVMGRAAPPAAPAMPQAAGPAEAPPGAAPAVPSASAILPALAAQHQQQQAAMDMQLRVQQLIQLQQHMALQSALAAQQQQAQQAQQAQHVRASGAGMSLLPHFTTPLLNVHLAQQQQAHQQAQQQQQQQQQQQ
eukprot:jgi/Ulvmu1/11871/UM081_0029.1